MKIIPIIGLLCAVSTGVMAHSLGQTTYQNACKTCHSPTMAKGMHAPAAFDKKAWNIRFKQAKYAAKENPTRFPPAMSYLLSHVKMGKGLMHHGGLCHESDAPNKDCSDEALMAAILYMSNHHD